MKTSPLKVVAIGLLGAVGIASLLTFYFKDEKTGIAPSLRDLPEYGKLFTTNVAVSDIRYTYYPSSRWLFVAGRTSETNFRDLCKSLGIDLVGYRDGNWPKLDTVAKTYLPTGELVYAGERKAYSEGRAIVHLYFSPDIGPEQHQGSMYIHIGG